MSVTRRFTAPGRIEICGNHTDHQRGLVLTAAIDLQTVCDAAPNGTDTVRLSSPGFGTSEEDLADLAVNPAERGTTAALIRGVAAWFSQHGHNTGGWDGRAGSAIPPGAGLSSSAAFEVLVGNVFKGLFGADVTPLEIAVAGQYAESVYFGKPCGLMDQCAVSMGGLMAIDFQDPANPVVTPVPANLGGLSICVVDTGGSHADLTGDYAAIPREMQAVAAHFGKGYLREVDEADFYNDLPALRAELGDRPVLRAHHFFGENRRVREQAAALRDNDISRFLALVNESGRSSAQYLQNIYAAKAPGEQGITTALAIAEKTLQGQGAARVHGGGFAGTVLAFVPDGLKRGFTAAQAAVFGEGACKYLSVALKGGGEA